MQSFIELEAVRFFAYHGVMSQERIVGNHFEVNIRVKVDFRDAIAHDKLDNTISYAEIYEEIKQQMLIPSNLIEHVAGRILEALCLRWPQIEQVELKVSKLNPPIPGDVHRASVCLIWNRGIVLER